MYSLGKIIHCHIFSPHHSVNNTQIPISSLSLSSDLQTWFSPNRESSSLGKHDIHNLPAHQQSPQVSTLPWVLDLEISLLPSLNYNIKAIIRGLTLHHHCLFKFLARFFLAWVPLLLPVLTTVILGQALISCFLNKHSNLYPKLSSSNFVLFQLPSILVPDYFSKAWLPSGNSQDYHTSVVLHCLLI